MSDLRRRLRKLEATFTDRSGLVPHSPAWREYWMEECNEAFEEDRTGPKRSTPLDVFRAWLYETPNANRQYEDPKA